MHNMHTMIQSTCFTTVIKSQLSLHNDFKQRHSQYCYSNEQQQISTSK